MSVQAHFDIFGFAVVRKAIHWSLATAMLSDWEEYFSERRPVEYNPVAVSEIPPAMAEIPRTAALIDIVAQVFGPDIALYNYRFVVKDKHARDEVFAHQDTGYHVGFPHKASLFVALSPVDSQNGGMKFYCGTHKYGYLGDAGEISAELVAEHSWTCPFLEPGDAVLMNSALWHSSFPHISGPDRVMADIIYQPANDPSGIELLRGNWRCTPKSFLRNRELFKRSRTSRLKELQAIVDKEKKP